MSYSQNHKTLRWDTGAPRNSFAMFTLLTWGFQLVVCGDFFQLPPVAKGAAQAKFAFEAELWSQCVERTFNLTKVFRQKEQGGLFRLLYHIIARILLTRYILHRIRRYAQRDAVRRFDSQVNCQIQVSFKACFN